MGWFAFVVAVAVSVWFFRRSSAPKAVARVESDGIAFDALERLEGTAKQIAARVKTVEDIRRLEAHLALANDAQTTDENYDAWVKYAERIDEAVREACKKALEWQYVPSIDLDTPADVLARAFCVVSADSFKQKRLEFKSTQDEWNPLEGGNSPEEPPDFLPALIAFRRLVDDAETVPGLVAAINALVANQASLKTQFFWGEADLSPGDYWVAACLREDGLPKSDALYAEGITTPELALGIDPKEFGKRPGVGPKTVAALEEYQAKVRRRGGKGAGVASLDWLR